MRNLFVLLLGLAFLTDLTPTGIASQQTPDPTPHRDDFNLSTLNSSYWIKLEDDPGVLVQQTNQEIRVSGATQDTQWGKNGLRTPPFPVQDFTVSIGAYLISEGEINQSLNLRVYFNQGLYFGVGYNDLENEFRAYYRDFNGYHTLPLAYFFPSERLRYPRDLKVSYDHGIGEFQAAVDDYPLGSYAVSDLAGQFYVQFHQESQVDGVIEVDARFDNFILDQPYQAWQCVPDGCVDRFNDLDMLSATDGWAVGDSGDIWHWDGVRWSKMDSPVNIDLTAIDMLSNQAGWAGGVGIMLYWNGVAWSIVNSPAWNLVTGLHALSADDAWATTNGDILHWDGVAWGLVYTNTNLTLYDIQMVAPDDGWAVGGTILHWDGIVWSQVPHPDISASIRGISMLSSTNGWAVGQDIILHWDGIDWQLVSSPPGTLRDIVMLSADNGWAVGNRVLHWDGIEWQNFQVTPYVGEANAVAFASSDDGWLLDGNWFRRWDGAAWTIWPGPAQETLNSVTLSSPGEGWVVGDEGVILRLQGHEWARVNSPTDADLNAVFAPAGMTDQAWIAGDGGVWLHWDGSQWISETVPTSEDLLDISFLASDAIWTVSRAGEILAWDGTAWGVQKASSGSPITGIDMLSQDEGYAVGYYWDFWSWDGASWVEGGFPGYLYEFHDIDALATDDIWLAGVETLKGDFNSRLMHWNGQNWDEYFYASSATPRLEMESSDRGWGVLDYAGDLTRWNGKFWAEASRTNGPPLFDVDIIPGHGGWAVGVGRLQLMHMDYLPEHVFIPLIVVE